MLMWVPVSSVERAANQATALGLEGATGAQEAAPPCSQPSAGHAGLTWENRAVPAAQRWGQPHEFQKPFPQEPSKLLSVFPDLPLIY